MVKVATATEEITDLQRLCSIAIRAADSQTSDGVDRCFDILCYLKKLNLSAKDLDLVSKEMAPLASLRDHKSPKIRTGAKALFSSWMRTRDSSTCDDNTKLLKKHVVSCLKKKKQVKRSIETETKKKTRDDHNSFAVKKPMQKMKLSGNPRSLSHEHSRKPEVSFVPTVKKNSAEMLELFERAKKAADVASAKGILLSAEETSVCVETLSLLIGFSISSTAPETKRIMERLSYLTKHKDRKICNSATSLLQHWSQSIIDQQHRDAFKTQ